jgi:ATP-dependent Clp protease ATP-binding subunit ClpC
VSRLVGSDSLSEKILYNEFSAGEFVVVDTEDDPDNPGRQRFVFTAVEGFVPPSSVELATTATENPLPPASG